MITHIDHINISVSNLDQSAQFFTHFFGFIIKDKQKLSGKWLDKVVGLHDVNATYIQLELPNSKTKLELIEYHHPKGKQDPNNNQSNTLGFRHIALSVLDIESIVKKLSNENIRLFSEIQDYETKRLIYCEGPDGIIIELAQYH